MQNAAKPFGRRLAQSVAAFTLIELLVVISIITLLVTFSVPSFGRARRFAKRTRCMASLRSIGQGMEAYLMTNGDYYPTAAGYPILKDDAEDYCRTGGPDGPLDEDFDDGCLVSPIYVAIGKEIGFQRRLFLCPADRRESELPNRPSRRTYYASLGTSYEWDVWYNGRQRGKTLYTGKRGSFNDAGLGLQPSQSPMVYDYEAFHGGPEEVNSHVILFADMSVHADNWVEPQPEA